MLISIKQNQYKYEDIPGERFEITPCGSIEYILDTHDIKSVYVDSESKFVVINETIHIKKETWLEIKKFLRIDEFDETKG